MKPSLVVSLTFVSLVALALAGPGGGEADPSRPGEQETARKSRLQLLFTETEIGVKVSAAGPDWKPKKGQYRVSCESFTIESRGDRPVLVFLDAVLESEEGRVAGSKIIDYLTAPGSRRVEGGPVEIKPMKGGSAQWLERQKEAVERGMKASEFEHRVRWEGRLQGEKSGKR